MKSKFFKTVLSGVIMTTLFSGIAQGKASQDPIELKTEIQAEGLNYVNMPLTEYGGEVKNSHIIINEISADNGLLLQGTLVSNSGSHKFSLNADTSKGYLKNKTDLSFLVNDESGDFNLLHSSFVKKAKPEFLATQNKNLLGKPVLSLYFKHKNTREVLFYDIDLSIYSDLLSKLDASKDKTSNEVSQDEIIQKQDINQIKDEAIKNKQLLLEKRRDNDYWSRKLFEPRSYNLPKVSGISSILPYSSAAASTCYQVVGCKDPSFSYVYEYTGNQPGQVIDEVIEWDFKAAQFTNTGFLGNIKITRTYTDSNYDAWDDPNFSALTLGHFDNTDGMIIAALKFNGSDSSSNPWGDTIVKVRTYGNTTNDQFPVAKLLQQIKKKPNWYSALWSVADTVLANSAANTFNGSETVIYDGSSDDNKAYSARLDDRRMGSVGNTYTIESYVNYRPAQKGTLCRYSLDFGVYSRNGFGAYNTKLAQKSIYYDLWYSYN
ncbi:hypothetical protein [Paenibacillus sp. RC84]|uniref:hypothetical protein n=1 Tax=Paenibacillus sp. RC84 TaxID=3156252 RepID=UPI00351210E0